MGSEQSFDEHFIIMFLDNTEALIINNSNRILTKCKRNRLDAEWNRLFIISLCNSRYLLTIKLNYKNLLKPYLTQNQKIYA